MCLHFLTFSLRLHLSHHCIILLISFCKAKMSVSSLINLHSLVSSANNITSDSVALGRSLTNNKNVNIKSWPTSFYRLDYIARYVPELTFLHLFLVPKSILVFCKIEQISNKTKILKTLLCHLTSIAVVTC